MPEGCTPYLDSTTMSYDRALTVFSPDGHLFQVEYALEAVNKGTTAVGIRGKEAIVLAVEKKTVQKLQDPRTIRKIFQLDNHVCLAFAGLSADARVLVDRARVECQSHRLTVEDPVSIEYITRYIADIQQKYTQRGGARPFGISTLLAGFDLDKTPRLFLTDPSGTWSAWSANAIGQNSKTVREFLEKQCKPDMNTHDAIKLAIHSLLEVVHTGAKNIDVAVMSPDLTLQHLDSAQIEQYIKEIEEDRATEASTKRRLPSSASDAKMRDA